MGSEYTGLNSGDYDFLQRFLDATKSNLFFAKGVIFVEGDAENILIPTIAKIIGYPLHKYGISIVNVGNTAFLRYSKIFIRKESADTIGVPVAIVTDLDVRPPQYYIDPDNCKAHTTAEEITAENPTEEAGVQDDTITITETDSKDTEQPYSIYKLKGIPELEGIFFKKEVDAKAKLREYLNKPRLTAQDKNKYLEEITDYEQCKKLTQEKKEQKYNVSNTIKVFVNTWTLEYDLALSSIREYVLAAINIAEAINLDEDIIDNINLDTYISEATNKITNFILDGNTCEDIAYLIYKPLLKNKASKAIAAQYLSSILSIKVNGGTIKPEQIVSDPYLNYIINAIKHVAIPLKEEEE